MRETGPVAKHVSQGEEKYLPLARVMLGQLKARLGIRDPVPAGPGGPKLAKRATFSSGTTAPKSGWWQRILPDGVVIRVATRYGQDVVEIILPSADEDSALPPVYLESGYVAANQVYYTEQLLLDYALRTVTPAWLDYLNYAYLASYPFPPEMFTCVEYTDPSRVSIPATRFERDRAAYLRKFPNHSTQSGKLLKLWYCTLGRKDVFPWDEVEPQSLVGIIGGPFAVEGSIALYTAQDGRYFLLYITQTSVAYAPLLFDGRGTRIRKALDKLLDTIEETTGVRRISRTEDSAEHADARRLEAYLFATALPTVGQFAPLFTFTAPIKGTTLYYGWAANWSGDRLSIVTHEPDREGCPKHLVARRYEINVDARTCELAEAANWAPRFNADHIWQPFVIPGVGSKMRWWYPCTCACAPLALLDADAPLYAWYKTDNSLRQIRYVQQTWTYSKSCGDLTGAAYAYRDSHVFIGLPGAARATFKYLNEGTKSGFYVADEGTAAPTGQTLTTEETGDNPGIGFTTIGGDSVCVWEWTAEVYGITQRNNVCDEAGQLTYFAEDPEARDDLFQDLINRRKWCSSGAFFGRSWNMDLEEFLWTQSAMTGVGGQSALTAFIIPAHTSEFAFVGSLSHEQLITSTDFFGVTPSLIPSCSRVDVYEATSYGAGFTRGALAGTIKNKFVLGHFWKDWAYIDHMEDRDQHNIPTVTYTHSMQAVSRDAKLAAPGYAFESEEAFAAGYLKNYLSELFYPTPCGMTAYPFWDKLIQTKQGVEDQHLRWQPVLTGADVATNTRIEADLLSTGIWGGRA